MVFPEISDALGRIIDLDHAVRYTGSRLNAIRKLLQSMRGKTPEKRFPIMMELLLAISDMSESICVGRNGSLTRTEQRLENVRIYCSCNYARQITLDEISRHVGMNKSAFCTFMRRNAGMTFSEYLNYMRLEQTKDKLCHHTDHSIAEIAMDSGFQSVTYFNRLFKRRYGCSPKRGESSRIRILKSPLLFYMFVEDRDTLSLFIESPPLTDSDHAVFSHDDFL